MTVGRLADFIAVDTGPYTCDVAQLATTKATVAVVGGDVGWQG